MNKKFFRGFLIYLIIAILVQVILFYILAAYSMANDISTEQRAAVANPLAFIINYVFGFPLSLFLHYDPVNDTEINFATILMFLINCYIQFSILSFIWRWLKRSKDLP